MLLGDSKNDTDDDYPLVYDKSEKSRRKSYWMEFNRRGFGAGGHPPLFFSHWSRNWLNAFPQTQHTEIESDTNNEIENSTETDAYGPGMSLGAIAGVEEETMDWENTSENVQLKRKRPSSATSRPPKVAKVDVATKVLGTALPPHSGGKGLKRDRAKKALKGNYQSLIRGFSSLFFCSCTQSTEKQSQAKSTCSINLIDTSQRSVYKVKVQRSYFI